jgi:peptidoglycan hydrolase-like protein with peptidoglycan-binding domain
MKKLELSSAKIERSDIADLHLALKKLNLAVADHEVNEKRLGESTEYAIKAIQKNASLPETGKLDDQTVGALNAELFDVHHTLDKTRASKLQSMLERLELPVAREEKRARIVGDSTREALKSFQERESLPPSGKLTDAVMDKLHEAVIKKTYSTRTKIGDLQNTILRAAKVAKVPVEISADEIKSKAIGKTTSRAIKAIQTKYNLPATGELDKATLDRIHSVAVSRGVPKPMLVAPEADRLARLKKPLRLNMVSPTVAHMQSALAHLGHSVSQAEFKTQKYGKTTRQAVLAFQKANGLPQTGHADSGTIAKLNSQILLANPAAATVQLKYRVRGSVRDELFQPKSNMVIHVFERLLEGDSPQPLATKKNHINGFFDITYDPPIDQLTGQVKSNFHLTVKLLDASDHFVDAQTLFNVNRIQWVNFNQAGTPYRGDSEFDSIMRILIRTIAPKAILDLADTAQNHQITLLYEQTGFTTDDIMRIVLSHRAAASVHKPVLDAEVFYSLIRQNLPSALPGDLLAATNDWTTIDQLTEIAANGIVFTDDTLLDQTLEQSLAQNIVSPRVKQNKAAILQALKDLRTNFTLNKPILIGNGNLKSLLDRSTVAPQHHNLVADAFIAARGINEDFWQHMNSASATVGEANIRDFAATVELGSVSKNHLPTLEFIKSNVGAAKRFKAGSDVAKLNQDDWVALINQNGNKIPDNIPGDNLADKVSAYGAVLRARAERAFPVVSLVASIKQEADNSLQRLDAVESFVDSHSDFSFKTDNLDKYLLDNPAVHLDDKSKEEVKVVQRVHKLSPDSVTGSAMVAEQLQSSADVYFTGKNRLVSTLTKRGVDTKSALKLYERSKTQYMQALARLLEFRGEIHVGNPRVIADQAWSAPEAFNIIGDIPDLESLFGSMDYCECEHCKSIYGPAAYLTDLLRFLKMHDSLVPRPGRPGEFLTVKEVLFQRRPDLGNIKLNCQNTNTPLPYIDLVCEILENNIAPQQLDFSNQTTLIAEELRAMPQYVRAHAYNTLAGADFPMNSSFNLWQEEARVYLAYLRAPRWQLMEAFQNISDSANKRPDDLNIAAEYFGISTHESVLITTAEATSTRQDVYWGFDTTVNQVSVRTFMRRARLTYRELLDLLMVRFVNPLGASRSEVKGGCNLDDQIIDNLALQKFDLMHRFLRLWRKCGWEMWELDLLIRNPRIGNSQIDSGAIVNLRRFRQLAEKLGQPVEILLSFYGNFNTEERIRPDQPNLIIKPLYDKLFQNQSITNPVDGHFQRPLDASIVFDSNAGLAGYTPVPTILSALAIGQPDFDILKSKTDLHLGESNLALLWRYTGLARGLRLTIKDLWQLLKITNTSDPFSTVKATLDLCESLDAIKDSGLSLLELDYILNFDPDSATGLRNETIGQFIEALRGILLTNQQKLEDLALNDAGINLIVSFNADGLTALTDAQVLTAIQPLQALLGTVRETFKNASFAVQESEYILGYQPPRSLRPTLIERIKSLQDAVKALLSQNSNQISSHFAASFGLTDQQSDFLLQTLIIPNQTKKLIDIASDRLLIQPDGAGNLRPITEANFPLHFKAYLLIHKISILVTRMKIEIDDLKYFQTHNAALRTLDLATLPLAAFLPPNAFANWLNLEKFLAFRARYPEPENASLRLVLDKAQNGAAAKSEIHDLLNKLTQWGRDDLTAIDAGLGLKHQADQLDYADAETYVRLQDCFALMKLTGSGAANMLKWANRVEATQQEVASQTRFAIKSKYDNVLWLEQIKPLQDDLREKKRQALVEYHLENSQRTQAETVLFSGKTIPNPLYWEDSNALFKYFLIDVEMSACQLTSRIKQAISSVQLFVQRCFLNLENRFVQVSQEEKADVASENAWSQWKWMKNYRIWEANRKVFLYPENWIEPELRDDKSSFFEELENEIMQNEVTHDHVEAAFLNYLHKVDEVAHLEVCGLYHQQEDLNEHELGYEIDVMHVIARTRSLPAIYYYRKYDLNYSTWSAWEKIDVDITGDHVTPVVYNRKLHVFWLVFTEKPQKIKKVPPAQPVTNGNPQDAAEPSKILEVQLGWTVRKEKGWAAKKISPQKVIHPWERPHYSYNLKPFYRTITNELWLDLYLSTSQEFNDGWFFDPYLNQTVQLTKNRFNETYLPWHSASFVFDGHVTEVKLKALASLYHFYYQGRDSSTTVRTNSFEYVHENFGEDGKRMKVFAAAEDGPRLGLPTGMHFRNTHLTNNRHDAVNGQDLRVLEDTTTVTLFRKAMDPFEIVFTQQDLQFNTRRNHPFFYQDDRRAFFIKPEWQQVFDHYGRFVSNTRTYRALPFYHPYTTLFIRELNRSGLDGLLKRSIQTRPESFSPANTFAFDGYLPGNMVIKDETVVRDIVDFSFGGAYSIYNWEIFFHAPMMIANRLSQNRRFEEATRWFHYVFDPTNIEALPSPQRYWVTKPFYETNADDYQRQRIEEIFSNLGLEKNRGQLIAWRNHPFSPHLIARYRPVAYQRNVVMRYLENLIAWGDQLFRQDTIESINQASLLYMLAYEILGRRPEKVPELKHEDFSFDELEAKLDEFGNARVDVQIENTLLPIDAAPTATEGEPLPSLDIFYFCLPNNDYLLKYWDTVEDRLFKIRHCMNIEGIVRQLPLFEPPIDPALLVKAAAAGIDLSSVLNDLAVGNPRYRFRIVLQRALDFCADVRMLGEKLLNALEKKDAEGLSLMRSQHEIQLLEAVKEIKKQQIDEAVQVLGGLEKAKSLAEERKDYYQSRDFMNPMEAISSALSGASIATNAVVAANYDTLSVFYALPGFNIGVSGFGGSPEVTIQWGTSNIAQSLQAQNSGIQQMATILSQSSSQIGTLAGYQRRKDEWDLLGRLAAIEIDQLQFQMNAAEIRQAIAEKDLENQELQIENAHSADEYMRNKYTNEQLFSWMITQISTVYFQAYQLAYDMAKKAERCFQYELGLANSSFIQFGYWDSLKKGLLAGDKMMTDLRRLEAAYLEQNRRELELTRNISLEQVAPMSLMTLKETGQCNLSLPEWLFDMDYPGHYMRRIKSVSVSIPCIAGPYTSVNCTLALTRNETRADPTGAYAKADENDPRFRTQLGSISSIATSHAQNDAGLFELNFNDERYLPFEGAGVISDWQIKMPKENNNFDFATVSDVILHIKYTARDGGAHLAQEANNNLGAVLPQSTVRLFSLKHQFSTEWHKLFNPAAGQDQELVIQLTRELYPFFLRGRLSTLKVKRIDLFVESTSVAAFEVLMKVTNTAYDTAVLPIGADAAFNGVPHVSREYTITHPDALGELRLKLKAASAPANNFKLLARDAVDDMFLACFIGT